MTEATEAAWCDDTLPCARYTEALAERDALIAELEAALVDHNDALRSAQSVAQREGKDTNWRSLRGCFTMTLAEHHDISTHARHNVAARKEKTGWRRTMREELEKLIAEATPGPWEVDTIYNEDGCYSGGGGCGQGFNDYAIYAPIDGKAVQILDTSYSDDKLIEEDFGEDGKIAWDCIGKANAALIVFLVNNAPTILEALATARETNGAR